MNVCECKCKGAPTSVFNYTANQALRSLLNLPFQHEQMHLHPSTLISTSASTCHEPCSCSIRTARCSNVANRHPKFVVVRNEILRREHLLDQTGTRLKEHDVGAIVADIRTLGYRAAVISAEKPEGMRNTEDLRRSRARICSIQRPTQCYHVVDTEMEVVNEVVSLEGRSGVFHKLKKGGRVVDGYRSGAVALLWKAILVKLEVWRDSLV